jgi:hypothetical protein
MKRSRHVHVIQPCFGRPLIGFRCFADKPWNGRRIFGSLENNVRRKAWLWKRKVNWWGIISNPIRNLGDHSHLCNF